MKEDLATRFSLDNAHVDRKTSTKMLGVWIEADPSCWAKNTKELIKRTYDSMSMFTKCKFAGLSRTNLINIYCFFVRSSAEYCSVVWNKGSLRVHPVNG